MTLTLNRAGYHILSLVALLGFAVGASAGISSVIFRIEASNASGSDYWEVPSSQLVPAGPNGWQWTLSAPRQLKFGPGPLDVIATLENANLTVQDNLAYPRVNVDFQIRAARQNATIQVTSATVYANLPAAQALATTAFSLTDAVNDEFRARIQGLTPPPGYGMFTARYNGTNEFTNLIHELAIDGGGTGGANAYWPPSGTFGPVGTDVHDFSAWYGFTLTANDLMTGQNTYWVTPEPSAVCLLALLVGVGVTGRALRRAACLAGRTG